MTTIQYLIQALMCKQVCNETDMRLMIEKSIKASSKSGTQSQSSQISINKYMKDMNELLRELRMEVCYGYDESNDDNTGTAQQYYYAIINTIDNDITRLSTVFSSKEILYFKKLMSTIIRSENKVISSTNALNIAREESITISLAENLIKIWCKNKWFDELSDGYVAIGVRTLMEMNVYIREHFDQYVKNCFRCKKLCIRGANCSDSNCDLKLHFYCADSTFIRNNKCPECRKPWTQIAASNRDSINTNESLDDQTIDNESDEQSNRNVRKTRKRSRR